MAEIPGFRSLDEVMVFGLTVYAAEVTFFAFSVCRAVALIFAEYTYPCLLKLFFNDFFCQGLLQSVLQELEMQVL